MSDNIQVAIRVRPLNARELHSTETKKCIQVNKGLNSVGISINQSTKTFAYDYVFDLETHQEDLFEYIGKPIATSVLTGYNGSIFAYGQTGSGKTYTIMGGFMDANLNSESLGILPRCLEFIFTHVKRDLKKNTGIQYLVKGSFLEIYNETINDLLAPEQRNLQIREDIKKGSYVEALHQDTVTSFDDTFKLLEKGIKNRHIGATSMNIESSRSHSVFTLQIESKEKKEDIINYKSSYFHLIDLAGSERQKMAETHGERLKEATMINKSLSCLGNVINSLVEIADGKQRHVPYRDSKLTFLLKDSLGGNSKTCIIANISPSLMCYGETLSTLRFAERAKLVKNRAVINEDTTGTVAELREEIKRLKSILKTQQDSPGQFFSVDFSERVKSVEGLLEQNLRIRIQSENALKAELEDRESYINELNQALEKCEQKIIKDRTVIKAKNEALKKAQKNDQISENKILDGLREEVEALRKENENHPVAAILKAENVRLKSEIACLEKELKESTLSLKARVKENLDFTEKLQQSLRKSHIEREQLHILLEEYSKKSKSDQVQELNSAKRTIQELKKSLEIEKSRVLMLENQLNSLTESQIEEASPCFSTLNSSSFNGLNENLFQQEVFQRFLSAIPDQERHQESFQKFMSALPESERHPDQFLRFFQELDPAHDEKIKTLEKHVHDLREENKILSKYEAENFKLDEELDKTKQETMNKDNKIEELQNEIETMIAENEFLSGQFIEFSQQLVHKEKKIKELTEKIAVRANKNQLEENMKLKTDLDDATYKIKELEERLEKMREELEISVNSRREMIDELKNLQNESSLWRTECAELRNKLEETEKENEKIKENLEEISSDTDSVARMNKLNQNIKLHSKMKDENNKLRDQNFQLREEVRKKNEKIEVLNRRILNFNREDGMKTDAALQEKVEELEETVKSHLKEIEDVSNFIYSLPLEKEVLSQRIGEQLAEAFGQVFQSISLKQDKIEELTQELERKSSKLRILENEILVIKQEQGLV